MRRVLLSMLGVLLLSGCSLLWPYGGEMCVTRPTLDDPGGEVVPCDELD